MKIIEASREEMKKNVEIIGNATGGFAFKGGYDKVNWKVVRTLCNFGYTFMPKIKDVKVTKLNLNGIYGELSIPKN